MPKRGAILPVLTLVALVVAWHLVVRLLRIEPFILPTPLEVAASFRRSAWFLIESAWVTGYETLLGFLAALALGIPLALLIAFSRFVEAALYPVVIILQVVPKAAAAPLITLWFGYGVVPQMIIALLIAFFPIIITTVQGMRLVPPELLDMAHALGSGRWRLFWKVRVPQALPIVLSGWKIAITLALVGAIVGEYIGAKSGLGYIIVQANADQNVTLMFAAVVLASIMGMVLFGLVAAFERLCIPWYFASRARNFVA